MTPDEAMKKVRSLVSGGELDVLIQHWQRLVPLARNAWLRIAMAVPADASFDFKGWKTMTVDPASFEAPVSSGELSVWMKTASEANLVRFGSYLHEDDPTPLAFDHFVELLRAHAPEALPRVFASKARNTRRVRGWVADHADDLVRGILAHERPSNFWQILERLPGDAIGRLLEGLAEKKTELRHYDVLRLEAGAPHAPEAFAHLLAAAFKKERKQDAERQELPLAPLDEAQIVLVLDAVKGKDGHFQRAAFLTALDGRPDAARALARFLGHAKRGRMVARCLSVMGAPGREAATAAREAAGEKKTKTADRVRAMADTIAALPPGPQVITAIANKPSGWNLDLARYLLDPADLDREGSPEHEPVTAGILKAALEEKSHEPEDLEPHHWADLLQIATIRGWQQNLEWAVEVAAKRGLLGWGSDPSRLVEAIDRYDLDQYVKLGWGSDGAMGLFHLLLGADAPTPILLHAMAVAAERRGNLVVGLVERNFTDPVRAWDADDRVPLEILATHMQMQRLHRIGGDELDRYPLLEESSGGARWTSKKPHADFRLRVTCRGEGVRVRFREGVELGVDASSRRWFQKGLIGAADGRTSMLLEVPVLQLDVEVVGPAVRFACNGTHVARGPSGHLYMGVKRTDAAVEVHVEGGQIQRVRITEMRSQKAAQDVARLICFQEAEAIGDLSDRDDEASAHALAVTANLADDEAIAEAAKQALASMSARSEPSA